ncbi:ABC transporter permease, partial [Traorella massiliensis]|uniref:FtsX-like permease family protein n=1 Tax=Traorella massiliensis TaxID=1903263 RepID=UPI00248ECE3D
PQILVSRQLFREIYDQTGAVEHEYHVYFQSNDSASLVRQLNIINDSFGAGLEVVNVQKAFNDGKIFISLIRILSYGYILSLILMGILATSSIASVNFEYRKKEFMLYRALGLRMKDMMILVFVELLYYEIQIFAGSWVLSQTLNYLCYQLYFKSIGLQFFIPENSLLGSIIFFVSAITIFMCYIYIRMRTLRYSLILKNEITMM